MLSLDNLQRNSTNRRKGKRLGRGNGSGVGSYSGKGLKGQRARSGGRAGITGRAIKSYLLRIPKNRGFQSLQGKMAIVNLNDLDKVFADGTHVNYRALLKAGLIRDINQGVKVLGQGKISKKLKVEADAFSQSALDSIKKAGGEAILVKAKEAKPKAEKPKPEQA